MLYEVITLKSYLSGRATLRRAFVLIDARHGIKAVDDEILTLLDRSAVTRNNFV